MPVARTDQQRAGDAKIDRMGTASTLKLLLEFSIPAVFGVLVQTLYNVIDAVYVGAAVGRTAWLPRRWRTRHDVHGGRGHARGRGRQRARGHQAGRAEEARGRARAGQQLRAARGRRRHCLDRRPRGARPHPARLGRRRCGAAARARLHDGHHRGLSLAVRGVRHEQLHPHGGPSQPRARLHARGHGREHRARVPVHHRARRRHDGRGARHRVLVGALGRLRHAVLPEEGLAHAAAPRGARHQVARGAAHLRARRGPSVMELASRCRT